MQSSSAKQADAGLDEQTRVEKDLYPLLWALMTRTAYPTTYQVKQAILSYADCASEADFKTKYAPGCKNQPQLMTSLLARVIQLMHFVLDQHTAYVINTVLVDGFSSHQDDFVCLTLKFCLHLRLALNMYKVSLYMMHEPVRGRVLCLD